MKRRLTWRGDSHKDIYRDGKYTERKLKWKRSLRGEGTALKGDTFKKTHEDINGEET